MIKNSYIYIGLLCIIFGNQMEYTNQIMIIVSELLIIIGSIMINSKIQEIIKLIKENKEK